MIRIGNSAAVSFGIPPRKRFAAWCGKRVWNKPSPAVGSISRLNVPNFIKFTVLQLAVIYTAAAAVCIILQKTHNTGTYRITDTVFSTVAICNCKLIGFQGVYNEKIRYITLEISAVISIGIYSGECVRWRCSTVSIVTFKITVNSNNTNWNYSLLRQTVIADTYSLHIFYRLIFTVNFRINRNVCGRISVNYRCARNCHKIFAVRFFCRIKIHTHIAPGNGTAVHCKVGGIHTVFCTIANGTSGLHNYVTVSTGFAVFNHCIVIECTG